MSGFIIILRIQLQSIYLCIDHLGKYTALLYEKQNSLKVLLIPRDKFLDCFAFCYVDHLACVFLAKCSNCAIIINSIAARSDKTTT